MAFSREVLLMFIAGSTYAESNASTRRRVNCPIKINMVLLLFKHVLAEARRVRFSVRSRTTFCLPPVFRSTIASLRSAIKKNEFKFSFSKYRIFPIKLYTEYPIVYRTVQQDIRKILFFYRKNQTILIQGSFLFKDPC